MQHQPHDAVVCTTHGNYGSTVFDAMDGSWLQFNICDECLILAGLQGRVVQCRDQVHHEVTSERWSPDAG